ncbi:IS66 family insertion sequence element accessory protein TnpB [Mesorhizobium sp. M1088]|uniref:IS66 family insertion sequence element accessory protein TnpB n=1 Tax=Mesorhizobium sp. M1088 TaxID=2957056 RepID=UPI00333955DB
MTEVAEAFGVAPSQLYAWRKQMAGGELDADQAMATFARIDVTDLPGVERPVADCPDPATVVPTDRIYLCCGATDMRSGINSLARMVQQVLALDPHTGAIFCFVDTRVISSRFWRMTTRGSVCSQSGLPMVVLTWPTTKEQVTVSLTKAQLSLLLDGIDWRRPSKTYRPRLAG